MAAAYEERIASLAGVSLDHVCGRVLNLEGKKADSTPRGCRGDGLDSWHQKNQPPETKLTRQKGSKINTCHLSPPSPMHISKTKGAVFTSINAN
jgi:hypothetical protein